MTLVLLVRLDIAAAIVINILIHVKRNQIFYQSDIYSEKSRAAMAS